MSFLSPDLVGQVLHTLISLRQIRFLNDGSNSPVTHRLIPHHQCCWIVQPVLNPEESRYKPKPTEARRPPKHLSKRQAPLKYYIGAMNLNESRRYSLVFFQC